MNWDAVELHTAITLYAEKIRLRIFPNFYEGTYLGIKITINRESCN